MRKRDKIKLIKRVWVYLSLQLKEAYERKDEIDFDWYSDGRGIFYRALTDAPLIIESRVKPL